jgi:Skp family chaperone for outer membrane proteins
MIRDIFLAVALTVCSFLLYSYLNLQREPIYVCDYKKLIESYTEQLNRNNYPFERKKEMLNTFLKDLRRIIDRYGAVWRKGYVTGSKVKDITPEVIKELEKRGYRL